MESFYCIKCGSLLKPEATKCSKCKLDMSNFIDSADLLTTSTMVYREVVEKRGKTKVRETWESNEVNPQGQYRDFSTAKFLAVLSVVIGLIWFFVPNNPNDNSSEDKRPASAVEEQEESNIEAAENLVKENIERQDSCFSTRTFNGDDPENARTICMARFPTSIEWALSKNHEAEQSCYETRVFNGDNPINARSVCLSRYPIR